ncbi:MAG TPA: MGMT family protein [Candidatus Thermoplasmatota archaeon]|nr:MGMT family protein [Candidatus Thermoplasmatota archaeon]
MRPKLSFGIMLPSGVQVASVPAPAIGMHLELAFTGAGLAAVRFAGAPSPGTDLSGEAKEAAAIVADHLRTGRGALEEIRVDLGAVTPFRRRTLEALRRVPAGEVVTYGDLARMLGSPGASRAVGGAMATNPIPIVVPCHRVVASNGIGEYSGVGSLDTKRALLRLEGVSRYG